MSTTPTTPAARYPTGALIEVHWAPSADLAPGDCDIQLAKVVDHDDDSHLLEIVAEWTTDHIAPPVYDNTGECWSLFDKQIHGGDLAVRVFMPEDLHLSNFFG